MKIHTFFVCITWLFGAASALLPGYRHGHNRQASNRMQSLFSSKASANIISFQRHLQFGAFLALSGSDDASNTPDEVDDYSPERKEGCVADKANHIRMLDHS